MPLNDDDANSHGGEDADRASFTMGDHVDDDDDDDAIGASCRSPSGRNFVVCDCCS